ncbi:MAG TPA: PKD domain-containing protein [Thermoplasmata archaeon]|nr:PKD domain-containing protein [Thermoplasmata archaeon]
MEPLPPPKTGPVSGNLASLKWSGNQVISSSVAYRNSSITLSGGNLIVASGGALTLDNDTLSISQANTTRPAALSHGFVVESGGQLLAKYSTILSANGSSYPAFGVVAGGARAFHVAFVDLGGSGSAPVTGREGIHVTAAHTTFEADLFDHTYEVLFSGSGAVGDRIDGSAWVNATITGGQVGWVGVAGGASWANLTHDSWSGSNDAGTLVLISGPHTTIANSTLIGDPSGTQPYQVYLTYDGWTDRGVDGSYASVVDNRFQTANLGISDGTHFEVDRNTFNDTGHWSQAGGQAAIIVVTWIGSGVGEQTRQVDIKHNIISNFTHYAIRVSQNVSGFNVSENRIFATESTYSSTITEADGIYLIRGVANGSVWGNRLDMTDLVQPSEPTNGIVLEAQVNDVNVSANLIYNCSEVGVTVQGDSGALAAPTYYLGPSSRDVIYGNRVVNFHTVAAQSMYSSEAIETWMWANGTRIVGNYIAGWDRVNTTNYWNGAGFLTSSSEQWVASNTMDGVRFGFVFEKFDSQQELRSLGSFNRSYNVLDGNHLSAVTVESLAENANDDMGPMVNLLSGTVDSSWTLWFSGWNATLRLVSPTFASFAPSTPYRASNVQFVGPVTLANLSTSFDFSLSQWATSPPEVDYAGFSAKLGTTSGWFNLSISSYSTSTGAVQWNATQTAKAGDAFGAAVPAGGSVCTLSLDGTVSQTLTATTSSAGFNWTGSGTHRFAIGVVPPSSGGGAPPLTAFATTKHTIGVVPLKVHFSGNVSGGVAPYAYAWRFGDLSTSSVQNPTHTYTVAGTYYAVLTVTDAAGSTANASLVIFVLVHLPRQFAGAVGLGTVIGSWPPVPGTLTPVVTPGTELFPTSPSGLLWLSVLGVVAGGLGAVGVVGRRSR